MIFKFLALLALLFLLASCANKPLKSDFSWQLSERDYWYEQAVWSCSGRLAMVSDSHSFSATIDWQHQPRLEQIRLVGTWGLGHIRMTITDHKIEIDDGNKSIQYIGDIDKLAHEHTGIMLPVSSLKYWLMGLVVPEIEFFTFKNGFFQSGWKVNYLQMQSVEKGLLPRKISIEKDKTSLKLLINQWNF